MNEPVQLPVERRLEIVVVLGEQALARISAAKQIASMAKALVIDTEKNALMGVETLRTLREEVKALKDLQDDRFKPAEEEMRLAKAPLIEARNALEEGADALRRSVAAYNERERLRAQEEIRKQREAEAARARAEAEARAKAEQALAEQRRQAEEAQARAAAGNPLAAVQAAQLKRQVDEQVEGVVEAQLPPLPAAKPIEPPRTVAGSYSRERWEVVVTDPSMVLAWILDTGRLELVEFKRGALNRAATDSKGTLKIDGAEVRKA